MSKNFARKLYQQNIKKTLEIYIMFCYNQKQQGEGYAFIGRICQCYNKTKCDCWNNLGSRGTCAHTFGKKNHKNCQKEARHR